MMKSDEIKMSKEHTKFLLEVKNRLLMFCYIYTFSFLGVLLVEYRDINNWCDVVIYTIPFFILLPFSCRIIYYRIWIIHENAYMHVFARDNFLLDNTNYITQRPQISIYKSEYRFKFFNKIDQIIQTAIDFIVNNEISILALLCNIVYFIKTYKIALIHPFFYAIISLLPIFSCLFIIYICCSTYKYCLLHKRQVKEWSEYKKKTCKDNEKFIL